MFIRRFLLVATGSYLLSFLLSAFFPDYAGIAFRLFATAFSALLLLELVYFISRLVKFPLYIERLLIQEQHEPVPHQHYYRASIRLLIVYFLVFLGMYELLFPLFYARGAESCLLLAFIYACVLFGIFNARNFFLFKHWSFTFTVIDLLCGVVLVVAAIIILTAVLRLTMIVF